jgi:two-component system response regulator DesR
MSKYASDRTWHFVDAVRLEGRQTGDMSSAPLVRSRLVIADDRAVTRRALRALLARQGDIEVVGEASDGEEAVSLVGLLHPDLVLLDVRMPRLDGIAAAARIKARWPATRVVAHSLAVERQQEALDGGVDAFVAKGAPVDELLSALTAR